MQRRKWFAAWVGALALVAASACTEDSESDGTSAGDDEGAEDGGEVERSGLLTDDGPCDESLPRTPSGS